MLLEVAGLSKHYRQVKALTEVSFRLNAGEVLGLIGPNGAGKSTLFECLAGVLPADAGEVRAVDRIIAPLERSSFLFYVPDGIAPWPEQPLDWVLDFTIGFFRGRADLRNHVVEQLGLTRFLRRPIGALSKGERKRALLGMGLLTPQPVLLIDEPFDGLDLRQAREIGSILRSHAARGRTLFLSIHQIGDAERFCDRFVLLSCGRVCGEGTVAELVEQVSRPCANLEEVFLALT